MDGLCGTKFGILNCTRHVKDPEHGGGSISEIKARLSCNNNKKNSLENVIF